MYIERSQVDLLMPNHLLILYPLDPVLQIDVLSVASLLSSPTTKKQKKLKNWDYLCYTWIPGLAWDDQTLDTLIFCAAANIHAPGTVNVPLLKPDKDWLFSEIFINVFMLLCTSRGFRQANNDEFMIKWNSWKNSNFVTHICRTEF